jgi:hypothetical protein
MYNGTVVSPCLRPPELLAMKTPRRHKWFGGAEKRATHLTFADGKAISFAALFLLFFATLSSSGCIGLTGATKPASGEQGTPGAATISVAPASVRFGSVAVGSTASQSVTISNGGGSNLTVTQASTMTAGVTITGISLPVAVGAGKQTTFDVVFSPKVAGTVSGNVSVMSDISTSPSTVSLSGTGIGATALLTASTSTLSFGNVAIGKSSAMTVTLTNAGNSNVTVSKVGVSGVSYSVSGISAGLILAPGQSATWNATFAPLTAGALPGTVTVTSNATNSPATISLSGSGTQTVSHFVALTWIPSTSTVAGYNVYRSAVSMGPYEKLDSGIVAANSFTDSSVQPGLTYYYMVTSTDSTGAESANSMQVSATIPIP